MDHNKILALSPQLNCLTRQNKRHTSTLLLGAVLQAWTNDFVLNQARDCTYSCGPSWLYWSTQDTGIDARGKAEGPEEWVMWSPWEDLPIIVPRRLQGSCSMCGQSACPSFSSQLPSLCFQWQNIHTGVEWTGDPHHEQKHSACMQRIMYEPMYDLAFVLVIVSCYSLPLPAVPSFW